MAPRRIWRKSARNLRENPPWGGRGGGEGALEILASPLFRRTTYSVSVFSKDGGEYLVLARADTYAAFSCYISYSRMIGSQRGTCGLEIRRAGRVTPASPILKARRGVTNLARSLIFTHHRGFFVHTKAFAITNGCGVLSLICRCHCYRFGLQTPSAGLASLR